MPARKKKTAENTEPLATPEAARSEVPPPTADPVSNEPTTAGEAPAPTTPDGRTAEGETTRREWQPDPFPLRKIALGMAKDSPTMTLYRSNKLNQVAIRFDERPAEEHRVKLREAGWKWREAEGVWTKQLDRERRAASQLEAERLFAEIGDAIRAARGLSGRTDVGG